MSRRPVPVLPLIRCLLLSSLVVLVACSGSGEEGGDRATDTLTRRQKDSLISTMPLPGAGAVGRALEASDSLRSRAMSHDTIR